jgi:hypothetical protein
MLQACLCNKVSIKPKRAGTGKVLDTELWTLHALSVSFIPFCALYNKPSNMVLSCVSCSDKLMKSDMEVVGIPFIAGFSEAQVKQRGPAEWHLRGENSLGD